MRARSARLAVLVIALGLAPVAGADVLLLKDGRILERPKMERVEAGVKVHFENGEVLVPSDQVQDAVIASEPPPLPETPEAREKAAKGLVPYEGRWVKPEQRDAAIQKRLAERRAAVQEIQRHREWNNRYRDESKHFRFEYTVAPHVFAYYRDLMEAYYEEFTKSWKVKAPKEVGKLLVCFYTDEEAFVQTGGAGRGTLGYFKFVPPLELNFFHERLDPGLTEEVMFHETNHFLQLLLKPDFNMPHFPGEALAEYYGASRYDAATKKLETGLVLEGRLAQIQTDVVAGEMMNLEKMLKTDGMYEHYTWGWSLAHFLMNDKRHRKGFESFVRELAYGKHVRRTRDGPNNMEQVTGEQVLAQFRRSLDVEDDEAFQALEAEWHAYVKNELKFVTPAGLEKGAEAAMRTGMPKKASRLFKEAIEKGTTNPLTFSHYAELLQRDGKVDEAIAHQRKAIELGPLEPTFYVDLGEALVQKGDAEEGKRLLRLGLELAQDDPWLASRVERLLAQDAGGEAGKPGS